MGKERIHQKSVNPKSLAHVTLDLIYRVHWHLDIVRYLSQRVKPKGRKVEAETRMYPRAFGCWLGVPMSEKKGKELSLGQSQPVEPLLVSDTGVIPHVSYTVQPPSLRNLLFSLGRSLDIPVQTLQHIDGDGEVRERMRLFKTPTIIFLGQTPCIQWVISLDKGERQRNTQTNQLFRSTVRVRSK